MFRQLKSISEFPRMIMTEGAGIGPGNQEDAWQSISAVSSPGGFGLLSAGDSAIISLGSGGVVL
jgi:hypothetical protein